MTRRFWKRAAAVWAICGVLTWAYADVILTPESPLEVKLIRLPLRIVTWPIRIYGLVYPPAESTTQ